MSRKLQPAQRNWHSNDKECFAVLMAMKKLYKFLIHAEFTVFTDHKNFEILLTSKEELASGFSRRWAVWMQGELVFKVRHVKGEDNIPSDYLSRDILSDTRRIHRQLESVQVME